MQPGFNWILDHTTRFLFFTGKGGVGKTSLASAMAVALTKAGRKVLLISTDPASNLGQVFEYDITSVVTPITSFNGLDAINIDPEEAAEHYRERATAPMIGNYSEKEIATVRERLSGACTTEIASFDEFTRFLADEAHFGKYDHVIFDTAPTGHTLRLLELPAAWSTFIQENPEGASCLGPRSGLVSQQQHYLKAVRALTDPTTTTIILVARPERSALREAERTRGELLDLGIGNQVLAINGNLSETNTSDPVADEIRRRQLKTLSDMPAGIRELHALYFPMVGYNIKGAGNLLAFVQGLLNTNVEFSEGITLHNAINGLDAMVREYENQRKGLIMMMGKGGVGKTTMACAMAVALAAKGVPVHLSTTDPAAHIQYTLTEAVEGLTVSKIDPKSATEAYINQVMNTKGKNLNEDDRKLLLEDLRSPCTEEIAVFHQFSALIREASRKVVIIDTAPTGHTLLLLDQTGAYHRDVVRNMADKSVGNVVTPFMRLQDSAYSHIYIVTLAEDTPILEAAGLQADLRRAGIEPAGWIVNRCMAGMQISHPVLQERASHEAILLERIRTKHAASLFLVPFSTTEPAGAEALLTLTSQP